MDTKGTLFEEPEGTGCLVYSAIIVLIVFLLALVGIITLLV